MIRTQTITYLQYFPSLCCITDLFLKVCSWHDSHLPETVFSSNHFSLYPKKFSLFWWHLYEMLNRRNTTFSEKFTPSFQILVLMFWFTRTLWAICECVEIIFCNTHFLFFPLRESQLYSLRWTHVNVFAGKYYLEQPYARMSWACEHAKLRWL